AERASVAVAIGRLLYVAVDSATMPSKLARMEKPKTLRTAASSANGERRRQRRGTGRARITDVAKLAGVAPITVSRALNAPDSVAGATLRRVQQAIDRLGYVPTVLAGGLAASSRRF